MEHNTDILLAENELYNTLIREAIAINYSDNIIMLEAISDTISKYLDKVTASTQKSWNNFNNKVGSDKQIEYLKSNADKIANSNPNFIINNFPVYDFSTLRSIRVIPFDYSVMKKQLKTKEEYINANYKNLSSRDSLNSTAITNIKKNLEKVTLKGYSDKQCNKNVLLEIYQFCLQSYQPLVDNIEQDLITINNSNAAILRTAGIFGVNEEANALYEAAFGGPVKKQKMTFTDANGEKVDPENKNTQKSYTKAVTNYMKVSTDILTAKMSLVNEVYKAYMTVVQHYVKNKDLNTRAKNAAKEKGKIDVRKQVQI